VELTDHQIYLLKICDHVRWREEEGLTEIAYAQIRRALGENDAVIVFELEQASYYGRAHNPQQAPKNKLARSPWVDTWARDPVTGVIAPNVVQLLGLDE